MTLTTNTYRKFAHDILNITGRLQSIACLLDGDEPPNSDDIAMVKRILRTDGQKLNDSLQLFCWWGWVQNQPDLVSSDIDLLFTLKQELAQHTEDPAIKINFNCLVDQATLKTDKDLLEVILKELIKNAVVHHKPDTPIDVQFIQNPEGFCLEIKNAIKVPIPESPLTPLNRRLESPGLGLGLALVQEAAKHMQSTLDISHQGEIFQAKLQINQS